MEFAIHFKPLLYLTIMHGIRVINCVIPGY